MILQFMFQVFILLLLWPAKSMAKAPPPPGPPLLLTKPNCPASCGNNVTIPFPFGIGADCYLDQQYAIDCRSHRPFFRSIDQEVLRFTVENSTILVNQPVARSCGEKLVEVSLVNLKNLPFYFSYDYNYFFGVGCNNFALMSSADVDNSVVGGCFSICNPKINKKEDKYCSNGIECCQSGFPSVLTSLNISVKVINGSSQQQECKYAFLVDLNFFDNNLNSSKAVQNWKQVPVSISWGISNSSYALLSMKIYPTTESTFSCEADDNGLIECYCSDGYQGNPYLLQGCQDVDECKNGGPNVCESNMFCKNYEGGYRCFHSAKTKVYMIFLGIGTGLGGLFLLIGAWRLGIIIRKRMRKKEMNFRRNGGLQLQQQLSSFDGQVHRCKIFNSEELDKATDHFNVNRILGQGGQGTVYKGMLANGRIIAVKKSKVVNESKLQEFINEVVILSQISHRNVVKLLGCCLETDAPLLVYEFIPNGTLFQYLHDQNEDLPFTWEIRLQIAAEVAGALSYLHSAAYLPIYHRDIKSTNILLDEKYKAKIADFGTSRSIAIDQTHVSTKVQGTFGYLDPEYFHTSQYTDKSDVYSFGVVLVELLTGQKPVSSTWAEEGNNLATFFVISLEEDRLFGILDDQVRKMGKREEIVEVANIAKRCLTPNGKKRPTMKEVAMELERIRGAQNGSDVQRSSKEVMCLRTEVTEFWDMVSTSTSTFDNTTQSCIL